MDSVRSPNWTRGRSPERITYTPPYTLSTTGLFDHIPSDVEALNTYRSHWSRVRAPERLPYTPPGINHSPAGSRASSTHSVRSMIDERMEWAHQDRVRSASRGPPPPESPFRENSIFYAEHTGHPTEVSCRDNEQDSPDSNWQTLQHIPQLDGYAASTNKRRASSPPQFHDDQRYPPSNATDVYKRNRSQHDQTSFRGSPVSRLQSFHSSLSSASSYMGRFDALGLSDSTSSTTSISRRNSLSHLHGLYICECCPARPKKFDTEDDLRLHESEKQYTCAYCPNRFKNKNEAERHQNALHLRRYSWSCAARTGLENAFDQSRDERYMDICGYCGEKFANPPNWEARAKHLNQIHKIDECNKKKFFRLDHFRQHLKHSHAGVCGVWMDTLGNACMKDELPPSKHVGDTEVRIAFQAPLSPKRANLFAPEEVSNKADSVSGGVDTETSISQNLSTQGCRASSLTSTVSTFLQNRAATQSTEAFICSICQRSFTRRATLENHQRSHTGEKPFECRVFGCNQRFAQRNDRARHEQAQHGEKTFVCGAESGKGMSWGCGKAFSRKDGLLEHQRKTAKGRQCLVERERFLGIDERT